MRGMRSTEHGCSRSGVNWFANRLSICPQVQFFCFKINLESEGFGGKVMQTQSFGVVFQSTSVTNTCISMAVNVGSERG